MVSLGVRVFKLRLLPLVTDISDILKDNSTIVSQCNGWIKHFAALSKHNIELKLFYHLSLQDKMKYTIDMIWKNNGYFDILDYKLIINNEYTINLCDEIDKLNNSEYLNDLIKQSSDSTHLNINIANKYGLYGGMDPNNSRYDRYDRYDDRRRRRSRSRSRSRERKEKDKIRPDFPDETESN